MAVKLTSFEDTIKAFLDDYAREDETFEAKYSNPNKSIEECCKYIYQEVEKNAKNKQRCVACSDEEVYGLAIHYYDEEDIQVDGPVNQVEEVRAVPEPKIKEKKPRAKRAKKTVADENIPEPLEIPLF